MNVLNNGGARYQIFSQINMIPFIDVTLVLLIIFMVMTPFLMESQIKIERPISPVADKSAQDDTTVKIQIQADGAIFIDGRNTPRENVAASLGAKVYDPGTQMVLIEADRNVPFDHVVYVMGSAKMLGVARIAVGVIEEGSRKDKQ